jgi:chromosomal replication initiation ATPase DnaA
VLSGISRSTKAVHVVDALAGTGKSHLARCLINRWGEVADNSLGFLVVALRTRTLRQEFLESVLADQVDRFKIKITGLA